jgi:hypothetical protein
MVVFGSSYTTMVIMSRAYDRPKSLQPSSWQLGKSRQVYAIPDRQAIGSLSKSRQVATFLTGWQLGKSRASGYWQLS